MSVPGRLADPQLADYLAVMSRAIFQAGLSWALIEKRWPGFVRAFDGFDVERVAAYGPADIDRLSGDDGIVRNAKKIAATVENARTILALEREYGGFRNYLRSHGSYGELSADLRRRFKFLGELSVYYLLFRVGEPVPPFEEWEQTIEGDHPRMREMVAASRGAR
jgi:DNA-3-methyladenine glycosylase I